MPTFPCQYILGCGKFISWCWPIFEETGPFPGLKTTSTKKIKYETTIKDISTVFIMFRGIRTTLIWICKDFLSFNSIIGCESLLKVQQTVVKNLITTIYVHFAGIDKCVLANYNWLGSMWFKMFSLNFQCLAFLHYIACVVSQKIL